MSVLLDLPSQIRPNSLGRRKRGANHNCMRALESLSVLNNSCSADSLRRHSPANLLLALRLQAHLVVPRISSCIGRQMGRRYSIWLPLLTKRRHVEPEAAERIVERGDKRMPSIQQQGTRLCVDLTSPRSDDESKSMATLVTNCHPSTTLLPGLRLALWVSASLLTDIRMRGLGRPTSAGEAP